MDTIENTELRAKGESMDLSPKDSTDAISALDALMTDEGTKAGATAEDLAAAVAAKPTTAPAPKINATSDIDDAAAKEKAASEKATADKALADKEVADKAAAEKAAADKAAADKAAGVTTPEAPVTDALDKIELPPHSSAKAAENFALLKKTAKEAQTALQVQLADRETKLTEALGELEKLKKNAGELPDTTKAELEDLRRFRLSKDVESDPTFRKFDSEITRNNDTLYKKLEQEGFSKENIERIKELGGPAVIDWEPLLPKLSTATRLFVQAKLVDNVTLAEKRDDALSAAKANAQQFLTERSQKDASELTNTANSFIKDMPWIGEKTIPATATPEQKLALEAHNAFAKESMDRLKVYLSDRSLSRQAELAVGTLLAHKFQADLVALRTRVEADTKAREVAGVEEKKQLETITKERDKLKADLEAIRRAEIPRVRGDGELSTVRPAGKAPGLAVSGEEALDALLAEQVALQKA